MSRDIFTYMADYYNKKMTLETLSNRIKYIVNLDLGEIKRNLSPIMWACKYNIPEVALLLIQSGRSNPEYVNKKGETALIWACAISSSEVALAL
ncbi:MAG: ankyrin repeat domain-containing protein, partial [Flavobacterium sp.]